MYHLAALALLSLGALSLESEPSGSGTGDNVFWLLALMGGIALVAGLLDVTQRSKRSGFPIPLIIYCHLLPMVAFVYFAPEVQAWLSSGEPDPESKNTIALEVSRWPLYAALAPLPFVILVRILRPKGPA